MTKQIPSKPVRMEASIQFSDSTEPQTQRAEIRWYTGAAVQQSGMFSEPYMLTLSMDPKHVDLSRLNNGAPFLLDHADHTVANTLGVIEEAKIEKGIGVASVKLSMADEFKRYRDDMAAGILRNVSVGLRLGKLTETTKDGDTIRSFTATQWTPREVSLVAIGADPNAKVLRAADDNEGTIEVDFSDVKIEFSEEAQSLITPKEVPTMETTQQGQAAAPPPDINAVRAAALSEERARVATLSERGRVAGMTQQFIDQHIASGSTAEQFSAAVFTEMAARDTTTSQRPQARVTRDAAEVLFFGASEALMNRIDQRNKIGEIGRPYANLTLMEMAKLYLRQKGVSPEGMSKHDITAQVMFGGMHSTGDFPYLLANTAGKVLQAAYDAAAPTYTAWTTPSTAPDFKTQTRLRVGESPTLYEVPEGSEIKFGTFGEKRETFVIRTYGRRVAITRQAIINDDLGAFQRIIPGFGQQVARLRNSTAYAVLTANAALADGIALFHSSHANLAGSGGAISIATLAAGRAAMRIQKGLDASTILNLAPQFLVVPAALELVASQYTTTAGIMPAQQSNINPEFNRSLTVIVDGVLDANSTTAWYLLANPINAGIEFVTLEGSPNPRVETRAGWEVEGTEIKVVDDFACAATDYRGLYKNAGA